MIIDLMTGAEKQAKKAEELPTFVGLSLLNIKQKVADLLSLIGRDRIFDEYTKHDVSHIDGMLKILDWLIPQSTKNIMSPADWLLTVLAIYFHDLGMLVTKNEYKLRSTSGFPEYRDKVLFAGSDGQDYRAKIEQVYPDPDEAERFLYQEFVRYNHAERIGKWIEGKAPLNLGVTDTTMQEVHKLVESLSPVFRRDLALVCESHHLEDLNDFNKYNVSRPYHGSSEETANVQYAAALLRTTDLLHITSDRTPSITFRVINPTDPLSQEEWTKQMAVNSVRPQIGRNREGRPDKNVVSDTIEVHAYFSNEDGFFGLTRFLPYVKEEIRKTHDWVKEANEFCGVPHLFPWRYIDDSHIDSDGFIAGQFGFEIDQAKILDLLTGHTLYNDTNVVIRELVQNSLDAVRLQHYLDPTSKPGKVLIHWDSRNRILSVEDNGTGMKQETIEKHFLKVGVSLYQDEKFREKYPDFSSISRFGIGVLSTFMIADSVEVTTCHPDDRKVRQISLRSVHDKYLIRSLDKDNNEMAKRLSPHGTLIKLIVRRTAEEFDVLEAARTWIVVPNCDVFVILDNEPPVKVGFPSPKAALEHLVRELGFVVDNSSIRVEEIELKGITVAYALKWSDFFLEWVFLRYNEKPSTNRAMLLGICIEGIRVGFETPGFEGTPFIAIANAVGKDAPKTNVARSGIEAKGLDRLLSIIYYVYSRHVANEIQTLYKERGFSLSWAIRESFFLLEPLLGHTRLGRLPPQSINSRLLIERIREIPLLLQEYHGKRQAISPKDFRDESYFWTIESPLFDFSEALIREVQSETSLSNLMYTLQAEGFQLPSEPVLCPSDFVNNYSEFVFENKEVDVIRIYEEQRRIDLRWVDKGVSSRWRGASELLDKRSKRFEDNILIASGNSVEVSGLKDLYIGVQTKEKVYLFNDSQLAKYLLFHLDQASNERISEAFDNVATLFIVVLHLITRGKTLKADEIERTITSLRRAGTYMNFTYLEKLPQEIGGFNLRCFYPYAWQRGKGLSDDDEYGSY